MNKSREDIIARSLGNQKWRPLQRKRDFKILPFFIFDHFSSA